MTTETGKTQQLTCSRRLRQHIFDNLRTMYSVALRLTADAAQAEELTKCTLVNVLREQAAGETARDSVKSYLLTSLRNTFLDGEWGENRGIRAGTPSKNSAGSQTPEASQLARGLGSENTRQRRRNQEGGALTNRCCHGCDEQACAYSRSLAVGAAV